MENKQNQNRASNSISRTGLTRATSFNDYHMEETDRTRVPAAMHFKEAGQK